MTPEKLPSPLEEAESKSTATSKGNSPILLPTGISPVSSGDVLGASTTLGSSGVSPDMAAVYNVDNAIGGQDTHEKAVKDNRIKVRRHCCIL